MSPQMRQLLVELAAATNIDEFVALKRVRRTAIHATNARAFTEALDLHATVYRDLRGGRGSAWFAVPGNGDLSLAGLAREAATRATINIGPAWALPSPAAPARVEISSLHSRSKYGADPSRVAQTIHDELADIVGHNFAATPIAPQLVYGHIVAEYSETEIATSAGFRSQYPGDLYTAEAVIAPREGPAGLAQRIRVRARRPEDLNLGQRLAQAVQNLRDRSPAQTPKSGPIDLLLTGEARLGVASSADEGQHYGWFDPLVLQAGAGLARRGLSRHRIDQSIYGSSAILGDRLTIASDGTLPFGVLSQPMGDLGEPVRPFKLVDNGIAKELALDLREAALRGLPPNGGMRNLVIGPGHKTFEELSRPAAARPLLETSELAWFEIDSRSGEFLAELGLGYLSYADANRRTPVLGGIVGGNVFEQFAHMHLSAETNAMDWFYGPVGIRLNKMQLR